MEVPIEKEVYRLRVLLKNMFVETDYIEKVETKMQKMTLKNISILMIVMWFLMGCSKATDPINDDNDFDKTNLLAVYPNSGKTIYLVDKQTFLLKKTIEIDLPANYSINRMCLSTKRDFFIFSISYLPTAAHFILGYNISKGKMGVIFPTGIDSIGAPRIASTENSSKPNQVYFYSHLNGLFLFDFESHEKTKLPFKNAFSYGVEFVKSSNKEWVILKKTNPFYSDIEFYPSSKDLTSPQFVLNENNVDNIYIADIFADDLNKEAIVTCYNSDGSSIGKFYNWGIYNLETKQLKKSFETLPWSINPYYIAACPTKREAYFVGASDTLYSVDYHNLKISSKTILTGKNRGPSRLLISSDNKTLFVSCFDTNAVFVIDLGTMSIINKINLPGPYLLIEL
ncbi:MAG: hypothetical protein FD143_3088 [Ignavibacteria bacterium]|nr:MAG: hypothetical protein FD143_3088 [Ignavibacteria bacterium]KAF0154423.1 MAG: hypothetical protein FD188_3262 [Ignavibacteria bacterium]